MRVGQRGSRLASITALFSGTILAGVLLVAAAMPAGAIGTPAAGFSINPASGLTVRFVAQSSGFPSHVVSYAWTFGDGASATTATGRVTHTYPSASTFSPSITERDGSGDTATASATIDVTKCPAGTDQCSEIMQTGGTVQSLEAIGPINPANPATVHLFVGPYRIHNCEHAIAPAVALTDSGFTGTLSVHLNYTTSDANQAQVTCFSSSISFVDSSGLSVHNGPLPNCSAGAPLPPCVQSKTITGSQVTKVLLVPPGDPKVGAP